MSGRKRYFKNSNMFYSQAGQDLWVLKKVGNKGFFVDVGAHDGVESSNTYALEKAGWRGICIEPNPEAYAKLVQERKCNAMNVAAGTMPPRLPLVNILKGIAPPVIDYLSIDVDGGEMDVLASMDFKKHYVKLITIEHNAYSEGTARQQEIFDYLTASEFRRVFKDVKCLDGQWFGLIYEDWYENINDKP